jgi:hypothetical protein
VSACGTYPTLPAYFRLSALKRFTATVTISGRSEIEAQCVTSFALGEIDLPLLEMGIAVRAVPYPDASDHGAPPRRYFPSARARSNFKK